MLLPQTSHLSYQKTQGQMRGEGTEQSRVLNALVEALHSALCTQVEQVAPPLTTVPEICTLFRPLRTPTLTCVCTCTHTI